MYVPPGFWPAVVMIGLVIFLVFGLDLIFGARLMTRVSRRVNKSFQVDQMIIRALDELKKTSDREFDVESSILHGWGRFVMGGLLLFGAGMLLINVLPVLK